MSTHLDTKDIFQEIEGDHRLFNEIKIEETEISKAPTVEIDKEKEENMNRALWKFLEKYQDDNILNNEDSLGTLPDLDLENKETLIKKS